MKYKSSQGLSPLGIVQSHGKASKLRKSLTGFTIIEVLIVLAIAGLILLIVFLAVPALQRNSRNTQRRSEIARMVGALQEGITNNGGQIPPYDSSMGPGWAPKIIRDIGWNTYATNGGDINYTYPPVVSTAPTTADTRNIYIWFGLSCTGTSAIDSTETASGDITGMTTTTNASSRKGAAIYWLEQTNGYWHPVCQEL